MKRFISLSLSTALLLSLLTLGGGIWLALDLLSHGLPYLAVITLILLLLALRQRLYWGLRTGLAAGLVQSIMLMPLVTGLGETPTGPPTASREITLMSVNAWRRNTDTLALLKLLQDVDADVVFLQEAGSNLVGLHARSTQQYRYRVRCNIGALCNLAILSKFPLQRLDMALYPATYATIDIGPKSGPWLAARMEIAGQGLVLINSHLTWPVLPGIKQDQLKDLSTRIREAADEPVIVAGDFNATPQSHVMRQLAANTGLYLPPGYRPSYPRHVHPFGVPIDHVLVSQDIEVISVQNGPAWASDHMPIIVRLRVPIAALDAPVQDASSNAATTASKGNITAP